LPGHVQIMDRKIRNDGVVGSSPISGTSPFTKLGGARPKAHDAVRRTKEQKVWKAGIRVC